MEAAGAAMERTSLGYVQDPGEMAVGEFGFEPVRLLVDEADARVPSPFFGDTAAIGCKPDFSYADPNATPDALARAVMQLGAGCAHLGGGSSRNGPLDVARDDPGGKAPHGAAARHVGPDDRQWRKDVKMSRQRVSSGLELERTAGYSRAVRVGNMVFVSGTAAVGQDGNAIAPDDAEVQTREILRKIERALLEAGARLEDVAMTRMYVTDIAHAGAVGRVHGEFFREIRPASLLVEVGALARPGLVVEIEAQAIIKEP